MKGCVTFFFVVLFLLVIVLLAVSADSAVICHVMDKQYIPPNAVVNGNLVYVDGTPVALAYSGKNADTYRLTLYCSDTKTYKIVVSETEYNKVKIGDIYPTGGKK